MPTYLKPIYLNNIESKPTESRLARNRVQDRNERISSNDDHRQPEALEGLQLSERNLFLVSTAAQASMWLTMAGLVLMVITRSSM